MDTKDDYFIVLNELGKTTNKDFSECFKYFKTIDGLPIAITNQEYKENIINKDFEKLIGKINKFKNKKVVDGLLAEELIGGLEILKNKLSS